MPQLLRVFLSVRTSSEGCMLYMERAYMVSDGCELWSVYIDSLSAGGGHASGDCGHYPAAAAVRC